MVTQQPELSGFSDGPAALTTGVWSPHACLLLSNRIPVFHLLCCHCTLVVSFPVCLVFPSRHIFKGNSKFERRTIFSATVAMAEVVALTLAKFCLDLQIGICMFLHPSDILALRKVCRHHMFSLLKTVKYIIKTCKALQPSTVAPDSEWFGWLPFIEYALTTSFSFQVSPYLT